MPENPTSMVSLWLPPFWRTAAFLLLALVGCGGPKTAAMPSAGTALTEFRSLFAERKTTMARQPSRAGEELDLVIEALAAKAETYGEPFEQWLEEVRRVREQWGTRPKKADVTQGIELLEQTFAGSPEKS